MNVHYLQHAPYEGLGSIEAWLRERRHSVTRTRLHAGDPLPALEKLDWLIVMGGPMNIYEDSRYPWLAGERRFIGKAIHAGKSVLGICLGAQLLADALGSRVHANAHKEIGWFPVRRTAEAAHIRAFRTFPEVLEVFHWHGDTFDLPPGAVRVASSEGCANQAFIHGERLIGMQFHPEMTVGAARQLIEACPDDRVEGPYIQTAPQMLADAGRFSIANDALTSLLRLLEPPSP